MRAWALSILFLLPAAAGQSVLLAEDPSGDVDFTAGGIEVPGYERNQWDLRSLRVAETSDGFRFTLGLEALRASTETVLDFVQFGIEMRHEDRSYRVLITRGGGLAGGPFAAYIQEFESTQQEYRTLAALPFSINEVDQTVHVDVAREWLVDSEANAPLEGRVLQDIRVTASGARLIGTSQDPFQATDVMPDSGVVAYDVVAGLAQTGHAHLASSSAVRYSNGEAGTFVFKVEATNLDDAADRFAFELSGLPRGWDVSLPAPELRIAANQTLSLPVVLTIPFAHQHGAFEKFLLEMTSLTDDRAVGRLELGVRFPEIPQPAGHHDTLFFHFSDDIEAGLLGALMEAGGQPKPTYPYMNALEDDPRSVDPAEFPNLGLTIGGSGTDLWRIALEPTLRMGLDFDLSRLGTLQATFEGGYGIVDAMATASLVHFALDEGVVVATEIGYVEPTEAQTLNGVTTFEGVFVPTVDLVPYADAAGLVLELRLAKQDEVAQTAATNTDLIGGYLQLPLLEYRDPVEDILGDLTDLTVRSAGPATKFVNPGETRIFNVTVTNSGAIADTVNVRVNGTNAAWATVLGDTTLSLPAGDSRSVPIAVRAPADASGGAVADLVVTVASTKNPATQAQVRLVAQVDALDDHPDETKLAEALDDRLRSKDSPGVLPLLALLFAGLAARAFQGSTNIRK